MVLVYTSSWIHFLRRNGNPTVPATALLIAACARHHGAQLETSDTDFELLKNLRVARES